MTFVEKRLDLLINVTFLNRDVSTIIADFLLEHIPNSCHTQDRPKVILSRIMESIYCNSYQIYPHGRYRQVISSIDVNLQCYFQNEWWGDDMEILAFRPEKEDANGIDGEPETNNLVLLQLKSGVYVFVREWSWGGHLDSDGNFDIVANLSLHLLREDTNPWFSNFEKLTIIKNK